jgi:hypothetical protein
MNYTDWRDNFSTLFVNIDFPEDWTGVRFHSKWTKSNSGGFPSKYEPAQLERFAKNPQFMLQPAEDTDVFFSMSQSGGRLPIDGQYSVYPFLDTFKYNTVSVWEIGANDTHLTAFDKDKIVYLSPMRCEEENQGRVSLKKGKKYVIVCACENAGKKGEFFLSVYFNQQLRDMQIKRVFHPEDKMANKELVLPTYIPEESEKLVSSTPLWKIKLVKESLAFMMTDEDDGANF